MKRIFIVLFFLISIVCKAQVYQSMPQWGYGPVKRFDIDSSLTIPTTCGIPTLRTTLTKKAAIAFDSCNNKFYKYNPKTAIWSEISGGGGSQNLQEVTDINDTTTNNIVIKNGTFITSYETSRIYGYNTSDNENFIINFPPVDDHTINFPSQSGTIALISDITTIDTSNKWVNAITKKDDSTFYIIKGNTTDSLSITGVSYANKLKTKVWNNSGVTIAKGSVIYINGKHSSNLPTIALAQANTELNSYATFALVENDIADNSEGVVIQAGTITNLNLPTTSFTDGQLLYLSPTIAGGITTTKPLAKLHLVKLGTVVRAHPTFGTIELKIENGWQLDELSDVQIPLVPNDSTLLQFSRVDSLWHSVSVNNAIGTKYLKPTDTASLSSRINTKLNTSDSSTYYTKYRSDTSRTAIYNAINSKTTGYAIPIGLTVSNILASTTYYTGMTTAGMSTTAAVRRVYIPVSGTIKACQLYLRCTTGTSGEAWTMSIKLNNGVGSTSIATVTNTSSDKLWSNLSLSIAVSAGDYIEITSTTPAWTSAPGNTQGYGTIFIQ